jgi:hypothetical protein
LFTPNFFRAIRFFGSFEGTKVDLFQMDDPNDGFAELGERAKINSGVEKNWAEKFFNLQLLQRFSQRLAERSELKMSPQTFQFQRCSRSE